MAVGFLSSFPLNINPQQKLLITLTEAVSTTKMESFRSVCRFSCWCSPGPCSQLPRLLPQGSHCHLFPSALDSPPVPVPRTPVAGMWDRRGWAALGEGAWCSVESQVWKLSGGKPGGKPLPAQPSSQCSSPRACCRAAGGQRVTESQPGSKRLILFDQNFSSFSFQGKHGNWRVAWPL